MNYPLLNDQLFSVLCEQLTDQAVFVADENGNIIGWNSGAERFYHLSRPTIINKPITTLFPEFDSRTSFSMAFSHGLVDTELKTAALGARDSNVLVSIRPLYIEGGLIGYSIYARNLFYEKRAGKPLQVENKNNFTEPDLFKKLIENSYLGISLFDADLNFLYRNPASQRITGYNDAARAETSVNDLVHPADQQRVKQFYETLLQSPGISLTCDHRARHVNGHFIYLECIFTNWLQEPGIHAIVMNFRDISEQKKVDQDFQQAVSEVKAYKYALDEAAIVAITDQTGLITHVNDNFCDISGYSREELLGQDHSMINSGYHEKKFIGDLWKTIASGRTWRGELRNRAKNGSLYWVATTIVPFLNDMGKPYQYMAIRYDITAAKEADDALRQKNQEMTNLLESITDGFFTVDQNLCHTYVNPSICAMAHMKAEDMIGRYIYDLFPDAIGSTTYLAIQKARQLRVPVTNEDYYAPLNLWLENRVYPIESGLSVFIRDISERKRAEQQQTLLSDIIHIFNMDEKMGVTLQKILKKLIDFSGGQLAEVWLNGTGVHQLNLVANATNEPEIDNIISLETNPLLMAPGIGLPGKTWESAQLLYWNDLSTHPDFIRKNIAKKAGLQSAVGIPLHNGEEVSGAVILAFGKERPSHLPDKFLIQLGHYLGAAVRRKQLKRELQDIFESVPDIICTVGTDRRFRRVNRAMSVLLGYSEEKLLSSTIDDLMHPDDLVVSRKRMQRFKEEQIDEAYFENRYLTKTGNILHLAWTVRKAAEKGVLFCVAKDITEKKELEQLLQKSSALARIGSWEVKVATNSVYWSAVTREILETNIDYQHVRSGTEQFYSPIDFQRINAAIEAVITDQQPFDLEFELITAKGNLRWARIQGEGEYRDGNCIRVYGSIQDIDQQKRAEIKLQEQADELAASGKRYSELFHMSPLPMFVFDAEKLNFFDINQAAIDQYGYSREEFLAMTLRDIRPHSEIENMEAAIKNGKNNNHRYRPGILNHLKKNGEIIQVEIISSTLNYFNKPARLALALDVTERNHHLAEIEAQNKRLQEISWMQSHIIRAPLSRIMGLVSLLKDANLNPDDIAEIINYIDVSTKELDQVVRDIIRSATSSI